MQVLLLGATGKVGSRLIPALLAHKHQVVIFVRSEAKLRSMIDPSVLEKCAIVIGNATDSSKIENTLVEHKCNAVVNSAGLAAPFTWQTPTMQGIVEAVSAAAVAASKELGYPIRAWFLGGFTVLDVPGMEGVKISEYFPLFSEHGLTYQCLSRTPQEHLEWSILAPSMMTAASSGIITLLDDAPQSNKLIATADVPPDWQRSFVTGVPYLGMLADVLWNSLRYTTKLEDCADFIAQDLEGDGESEFVRRRVGVMESGKVKGKTE